MNAGKNIIDWLYNEHLKVDDKWAVKTPHGFKWWADKNAQTIEIVGHETGLGGKIASIISVRTELLRSLKMHETNLEIVNNYLMKHASMAGPVYDQDNKTLTLCSQVWVYDDISYWMKLLIGLAARLQIGEAKIYRSILEKRNMKYAISGHPENGIRKDPDETGKFIKQQVIPSGRKPSRWTADEFQQTVDKYMYQPPALLGTAGGRQFTVEFPFGDRSSLCQVIGNQPHAIYGNGLYISQAFPLFGISQSEGIQLALDMNKIELTKNPFGYGFGSYTFDFGMFKFNAFYPNIIYMPGFLTNIYLSCAERAREMSVRLTNKDWTPDSFQRSRSPLGKMVDQMMKDNK